jgi:hypothetical protein
MRIDHVISKAASHIVEAIKQNNYKDDISKHLNFNNASEDEAINTLAWCMLNNRDAMVIEIKQGVYNIK